MGGSFTGAHQRGCSGMKTDQISYVPYTLAVRINLLKSIHYFTHTRSEFLMCSMMA